MNFSRTLLFLISRALNGPLEALYSILIFILNKEAGATLLQLSILASAKPLVSFIGFHLNDCLIQRRERLRPFLIIMNAVGALPALFFPFIENSWFFVASYVIFMASLRAMYPAWSEMLKGQDRIGTIISQGTSLTFCMITFVPLLLAYWLDTSDGIWKLFFFFLGLLQCLSTFLLFKLPILDREDEIPKPICSPLLSPWKSSWHLLQKEPDFMRYIALFFLGGAGIVGIQSLLPKFFQETLHLSYIELTLAISFCKGVGFLLASPRWAGALRHISLFRIQAITSLFSCLFILFLLCAKLHVSLIFLSYLMYGIMHAGCELSWNVSGIMFSKENESTLYSNVNLAFLGIRGLLCHLLAPLLFIYSNIETVFVLAGIICLVTLLLAIFVDKRLASKTRESMIDERAHSLR